MKDFLKIFLILCAIVAAFVFGRQYGEESFKQGAEYKAFTQEKDGLNFSKNDFENAKIKIQNILDGSENKKSEELLTQILQIFISDFGLHIKNQNSFTKVQPPEIKKIHVASEAPIKKEKIFNYKKLKSYEWILKNSQDASELRSNLKSVEIKDIDSFMKGATEAMPQQLEPIYGSYRGRLMDVTQNEYGTLSFEMSPVLDSDPLKFKGSIKIFRNEKETSIKNFSTAQIGFQVVGSDGLIIENGNTFYQLYKIQETQKIAGFYYERLVNGTTKTIGSFILNRVDQF